MINAIDAARCFALEGQPQSCERYGFGHINATFLLVTDTGRRYILQRINEQVFGDIPGMMRNIAAVTRHIATRIDDPRGALHLIPTTDGQDYFIDAEGKSWRVYDFIEGSICLQKPETADDFYQSAVAFGRFQQQLSDFPAHTLCEAIPNFHNTPMRYEQLRAALAEAEPGRAERARAETEQYLAQEERAGALQAMLHRGELPLRVTHNDTKLNNVMLDAATRHALCVIDLDTVMPGLMAYDFGDSIRFGAATAAEDERELERMTLDLGLFRTYTRGYMQVCRNMTDSEAQSLPLGALLMTLECGVRFLADYLAGDRYFAVHRPDHNLDRCRTQIKLVQDMESKWDAMQEITAEERRNAREARST